MGGGLKRRIDIGIAPHRSDTNIAPLAEGFAPASRAYVQIDFARRAARGVDPAHYSLHRVARWRVAVPRAIAGHPGALRTLLWRIYRFGPQPAGFVRVGDTLVPAALGPGDRLTLAQAALR
jgi:hypothetical protein